MSPSPKKDNMKKDNYRIQSLTPTPYSAKSSNKEVLEKSK